MANREHLDILKQGVEKWNRWRSAKKIISPDLKWADLEQVDLAGFNLSGANFFRSRLMGTNFDRAILNETNFERADLFAASFKNVRGYSTNFSKTSLSYSRFNEAALSGASFTRAILEKANFSDAKLNSCVFLRANFLNAAFDGSYFQKANFEGAFFSGINKSYFKKRKALFIDCRVADTTFSNCDLGQIEGLQTFTHDLPSTVGIDTIYKSGGDIPEIFLRRCGVPETFITYAKSLIENPIDFYSCFISFTEKDDTFSERLYNDMQAKGIRCWRWKEDAKWGRTLRKEIDEAVRYYDKLVIICSKDSLNAPAVLEEIERALDKEDAQKRAGEEAEVLFPIRIDDFIFDGWDSELKVRLTKKNIGDFREWNGDAEKYRKSVERLVRDLNRPRK